MRQLLYNTMPAEEFSARTRLPEAEISKIEFLRKNMDLSSCNFMAVEKMGRILEKSGFKKLDLKDKWDLNKGEKYYVVRNDTALFAFITGSKEICDTGFKIIASHSDSPCFKLKPNPEIYGDGGVVSLNVEKYGGGILYTWFDRPLSLAARVMLRSTDPMQPEMRLVDLQHPVAVIPHLAIHFNREVNEGNKISVQKDMKPVIGNFPEEEYEKYKREGGIIKCLIAESLDVEPADIMGMEVVVYPFMKSEISGIGGEYIMSPRLDDLSMAWGSLQALLDMKDEITDATRVIAIFDNEETGSGTRQGAAAPTLRNILERISTSLSGKDKDNECFFRGLEKTFMISADDAHAWHPNYNEKYDPTNHPVIGGGPVIKINANCKYMTDSRGAAIFRGLCEKAGVKCQYFVNHADVAGGSTLGNILTSQLDISGVDMGCAIWAMHSACETGGVSDYLDTVKVFGEFFKTK